jgi:enoyl-CoA hydratase/carnithine racemase
MTLAAAIATLEGLAAAAPSRAGRVRWAVDGPIGVLTLDNPASRNAVTLGMMAGLGQAVAALRSSPVAVVLVEAVGDRAFCSGGQVDELTAALDAPAAAHAMCLAMGTVLDALLDAPFASIAAVDGPAIGGGAELVTAVDLPLLGPAGWVYFAQVGLGIPTGWGGTRRLVQRIGRLRALEVALGDARLDGAAVAAAGLGRAGAGSAASSARELAEAWVRLPVAGIRGIKRQIAAATAGDPLADADAFAEAWGAPAHRAALAARR